MEYYFINKIMISILPNIVELSHIWVLTNFTYKEPELYASLCDYSKEQVHLKVLYVVQRLV